MNRYSRQSILPEIGPVGQKAISGAKVLVIGAGGLGCSAAQYLAAAGVGKIGLMDFDKVDFSNLNRQVLFTEEDVGQLKTASAKTRLEKMNSDVDVVTHDVRFDIGSAHLAQEYDVLIDCTDNFSAKYLINDACLLYKKPLVYAAVSGFEGRLATFFGGSCYRCLHPEPPKSFVPNCQDSGMLGAVVGVLGTLQALEAIKAVMTLSHLDTLKSKPGHLTSMDLISLSSQTFKIPQRSDCLCTRNHFEITQLPELCQTKLESTQELSWAEAPRLSNLLYFDVREEPERSAHIQNDKHFPLSRIERGELPPFLSAENVWAVYCQGGVRSKRAIAALKSMGISASMYSLSGGIQSAPDDMVTRV